jgi:hypothetical protein
MMEVEFTAGVWTDVTADVEWRNGVQISSAGRNSEFGSTQPRSMTFDLNNSLGTYTPKRQTLADGTTVHPYYPNVLPRKRVRYSYFVSASKYIRFLGYVTSWGPTMEGGVLGVAHVTATDRLSLLARVTLDSPIREETLVDAVTVQFPLTEPAGATTALARSGNATLGVTGTSPALLFGDNGPGFGDGTGVKFAPASATSGQTMWGFLPSGLNTSPMTFEVWVNAGTSLPAWATGAGVENVCAFDDASGQRPTLFALVGGVPSLQSSGSTLTASASIADGGWHHLAITRTFGSGVFTFYVDGVSIGTLATWSSLVPNVVAVGETTYPGVVYPAARFQGNIGYVGMYSTALSAARVAAHFNAGRGYVGDTTDARIQRWLTDAGLTSSDWNMDAGVATVNTYPQAGKDVISAAQDVSLTEAGGSAIYIGNDGRVRFANRNFRNPAAPALTLDATLDLDNQVYAPSVDELTLINQTTGSRATTSGTQTTQVYQDATSQSIYGPAVDSGFTSYAQADSDVLQVAQWRVANNAYPGFRLRQVAVDLMTAANSLYTALASVEIGSRIRITNLPNVAGPATQVDLIVEGYTETPSTDSYKLVFDATPADNPAVGVWSDTNYGLWQAGSSTLNSSLTAGGTTVVIATSSGPTWSTTGGDYPLNIKVNEEIITLNNAPGGSTSPQTFTGVTRGVSGSVAAAQSSGSAVDVYQTATFGL